jgi:ketopantoate reductase
MDAIMLSTKAIKSDKNIQDLSNIISTNRTLQSIKNKLRKEEVSNNVKTRRSNNVKSRRRKKCLYGFKKSGGCKKKPGPKYI